MNCYYHPDREAIGTCVSCGKPTCAECKVVLAEKFYCNPCVDKIFSGKVDAGTMVENTSGQGSSAVVPKEIRGWNWGGFLLTWVWAIGNKVWLGVLASVFAAIIVSRAEWVGWLTLFIVSIVFGINGNKWAWHKKRWDSIEHFKRTQRTWAWWGLGVSIVFFTVGIMTGVSDTFISDTFSGYW